MVKPVIFLICLVLSLSASHAQTGPVTAELRAREFQTKFRNITPGRTQENFCAKEYKELRSSFLQLLYQIDANLPAISESKRKRLAFIIQERRDRRGKSDEYSRNLWAKEMLPDADYWQLKLESELKPLIKKMEGLSWEDDRKILNEYLNLLRGKKYYSTAEQSKATNLVAYYIDIHRDSFRLFEVLSSVADDFRRLSQASRLEKTFGDNHFEKLAYLRGVMPLEIKYVIECNLEFLGTF